MVARTQDELYALVTIPKLKQEAKNKRNNGRFAPLAVSVSAGECTFDMDRLSQDNISVSIACFDIIKAEAVAGGWPDNGTIPWTLADNTIVGVTAQDLVAVRDAAAQRAYNLHIEYQQKKAALLAPSGE